MTAAAEIQRHITVTHQTAAGWYPEYVDPDDLHQELALYAWTNETRLTKWIDDNEGHRVSLALRGVARMYGLREKARQLGFEFEDVAWYSPEGLATVVPLALDESWDGLTGEQGEAGMPVAPKAVDEGGTLLAMVMDVRRVISTRAWLVNDFDPETESGLENLLWLAERLGGQYPSAPGYARGGRKVMSNVQAQRITGDAA